MPEAQQPRFPFIREVTTAPDASDQTHTERRQNLEQVANLTATNIYQYEPLPTNNHIRVLELYPGKWNVPIQFKLRTVSWDDKPVFEAISYAWGDATLTETCLNDEKEFVITKSLHDALLQFRRNEKIRTLWADAVCINQQDKKELSHHVSVHMLRIFKEASRTLIWLGFDNEKREGDVAIKTINRITDRICINSHLARHEIPTLNDPYETLRILDKRAFLPVAEQITAPEWSALNYLYSKSWFHRLWVIGEFNQSSEPTSFIGTSYLGAHAIAFFAAWCTELPASFRKKFDFSTSRSQIRKAASMRRNVFRSQGLLFHTLHTGRRYTCTDPRDRVYAMFGIPSLAKTWERYGGANYLVEKEAVYKNVVDAVLRSEPKLRILAYVSHRSNSLIAKPSWVPQWDYGEALDPIWWRKHMDWNASYNRKLTLPWFQTNLFPNNKLKVEGLLVDKIHSVIKIKEQVYGLEVERNGQARSRDDQKEEERGHEWAKMLAPNSMYKSELGLISAFSQTLHCGLNEYGQRIPNDDDQAINLIAFLILVCGSHAPVSREVYQLGNERLQRVRQTRSSDSFLAWNQGWAGRRTFFKTKNGYIGMAPDCVKVGDQVCLLWGADVPFILRRDGENEWLLVGESYCHGLMEGEYVRAWEKGSLPGVKEQVFTLT